MIQEDHRETEHLDRTLPPLNPQIAPTDVLTSLFERSKHIVAMRYKQSLIAAVIVLVFGVIVYTSADQGRLANTLLILAIFEVMFLAAAYINFKNRNLEHSGYRIFNRLFYGLLAKLAFFMVIVRTIVNLISLLNPYRGLRRNRRTTREVLFNSTLDITITLPTLYQSFTSAEIVEEYFKKKRVQATVGAQADPTKENYPS